jgi:hypothetical protein
MPELINLRDLPGVAEIEAALHVPGRQLDKQYDDLDERIAKLSRRLFGLADAETAFVPGPSDGRTERSGIGRDSVELFIYNEQGEQRLDAWEAHFEFLDYEYDEEAEQFWTVMGWDVTDGSGEELLCMEYFGRPLTCLVKRLHPAARLSNEGGAPASGESAEEWGRKLEEEARRFKAPR